MPVFKGGQKEDGDSFFYKESHGKGERKWVQGTAGEIPSGHERKMFHNGKCFSH